MTNKPTPDIISSKPLASSPSREANIIGMPDGNNILRNILANWLGAHEKITKSVQGHVIIITHTNDIYSIETSGPLMNFMIKVSNGHSQKNGGSHVHAENMQDVYQLLILLLSKSEQGIDEWIEDVRKQVLGQL